MAAKAKKAKKGFTPTPAAVAPAGTYDPGLDAQRRAATRGLLYTQQDAETAGERASTAHTTGVERTNAGRSSSLADLLTGRDRGKADLATSLSRSRLNTGRLKDDLNRGYNELGAQQTGRAASTGFVDTGSIAASGAARKTNQDRDTGRIDSDQQQFEQDNTLAGSRLDEDYNTGVARTNQAADWQVADLGADYSYGTNDRATSLSRALSEDTFYGQDIDAAKMAQATGSGLYSPPEAPKNEFTDAKGPYQLVVKNGLRWRMRPDGKMEPAGVAT